MSGGRFDRECLIRREFDWKGDRFILRAFSEGSESEKRAA